MRNVSILGIVVASFLPACSSDGPATATPAVAAYCGADSVDVERRIDRLLPRLTLEQKVGLMHGTFIVWQPNGWTTDGLPELGIPGFAMVDGPRGVSRMIGNATAFPVGIARGATWDPALEERVGEAIGLEARAKGADVLLAPTINLVRHPRWGRAQESYGEDSFHMGSMAVPFIVGAQRHVLASAKHFAANSIENSRLEVDVQMDERTLREVYLPHFRRAVVDAHVASVMSAYNSVNGAWCSQNTHLLRDILKDEWGFAGFVESDWVWAVHDTVGSALAGLDLEMPAAQFYGDPLVTAVDAGQVPEHLVDDSVRRILRATFCYHLDTNPPVADASALETPATYALAREVAERSTVLLQNAGNALPLPRTAGFDVAVIGPLADVENLGDDKGSSAVTSTSVVTLLEGLVANAGGVTITHVPGTSVDASNQAAIAAADAVVVAVGLTSAEEGEAQIAAGDRTSLALPAAQAQLVADVAARNARVIVVLEGGSAITMDPWLADVEAVVMAWYPGVEGGNAVARILFGDVNPSGRLPLVFPRAEADLPPFDDVSTQVTYGYLHGYRYLDANAAVPLFPFGFGLSYTSYAYANVALEASTLAADGTLRVSFDVTNAGSRAGIETPQLYVSVPGSSVMRAPRDLRAFTQVSLAPGETKRVTLEVPVASLAYWDVSAGAFRVEPTTYRVSVGSSSRDLPLEATFVVGP